MIRKLKSGEYRLYSRKTGKDGKRKNLGTFSNRAAAEKHERAVQFFKHHWSASREPFVHLSGRTNGAGADSHA